MKIICIDSVDPENVTEALIEGNLGELEACEHRDELRKTFEGKAALWFEAVADDYVLKAAPPSSPPPPAAPAPAPIGNEPDGTPQP